MAFERSDRVRRNFACGCTSTSKFIAFCGPMSGVPTGQSVALRAALESVPPERRLELDTGGGGLRWYQTIARMLRAMLTLNRALRLGAVETLYVTPSRSLAGAVRDLPFVTLARWHGTRIVAHWHGAEFLHLRQTPRALLACVLRAMWQAVSSHVALCTSMQSDMQAFGFSNICVIPNFCPQREALVVSAPQTGRPLRLLYLSNLVAEKGVGHALEMHRRLLENGFPVELHVVGARLGWLPDEVEAALQRPNVVYHGPLYGTQKNAILDTCDVFVFPSTYRTEAFPLVLLEAMSAGLAVVAYQHNYISDFFEPAGGFLVPCDVNALTNAVRALLQDQGLLASFKEANHLAALLYSQTLYQKRIRSLLLEATYEGTA
jgi:glycosyltransferase involved in cell wall biosynthesis